MKKIAAILIAVMATGCAPKKWEAKETSLDRIGKSDKKLEAMINALQPSANEESITPVEFTRTETTARECVVEDAARSHAALQYLSINTKQIELLVDEAGLKMSQNTNGDLNAVKFSLTEARSISGNTLASCVETLGAIDVNECKVDIVKAPYAELKTSCEALSGLQKKLDIQLLRIADLEQTIKI